jgi:predicted ribosomally synthesized peptide with SipW-like signal peptide
MRWVVGSVVVTGILSCLLMLETTAAGQHGLAAGAAACFSALLVAAGVAASWTDDEARPGTTTALIALGYLWGGATLITVYTWSGVWWQHGRQYGTGMVVVAVLILALAWRLGRTGPAMAGRLRFTRVAAGLQALAAIGGLAFLIGAGKLASVKGDWPANLIFLSGGIAIAALSLNAVIAGARSSRS